MNDNVTDIWKLYETGKRFLNKFDLVNQTTQAFRFYEGDHWHGLDSGGEKMPIVEVIKPIIDYKTMVLTTNTLQAVYTSQDYDAPADKRKLLTDVCEKLGNEFIRYWEHNKMEYVTYDLVMDAMISGDSYIYLYYEPSNKKLNGVEKAGEIISEIVPNTNIMFADENESDVQKQEYIIIVFRRNVDAVKRKAKEYGCSKKDIDNIVPDELKDQVAGVQDEVENESKCLCVMKLWKENGLVHVAESTKTVVYRKDTELPISLYPVASYVWERRKGLCRGVSEVSKYIPNQIWVNRIEAYRLISAKICAFPKLVFSGDLINKEDINTIGAALEVEQSDDMRKALDAVGYINPAPMSQDAQLVLNEILTYTKDSAGASDIATGRDRFDNYSALMAIQESAAAPLARQTDRFKEMVEDIAKIVFEFWVNYLPGGLKVTTEVTEDSVLLPYAVSVMPSEDGTSLEAVLNIPSKLLDELDVDIRIDITPTTPFNKLTQQQKLDNLLVAEQIAFDEYVELLPDDEPLKPRLERIVEKRQEQQQMMEQMQQEIASRDEMLEQAAEDQLMKEDELAKMGEDLNREREEAFMEGAVASAAQRDQNIKGDM